MRKIFLIGIIAASIVGNGLSSFAIAGQKRIRLHVIAFDVGADPKTMEHLNQIADASGGNFHKADALPELVNSVQKAALGLQSVSGGGGGWGYDPTFYSKKRRFPWKIVFVIFLALCNGLLLGLVVRKKRFVSKKPLSSLSAGLMSGDHYYPLSKLPCDIGTDRRCDFVIQHPQVSRNHARIEKSKDMWEIQDLGSTNGTYVNGIRVVGKVSLFPGDLISLAGISFRFHVKQ
jgi:FHA domain